MAFAPIRPEQAESPFLWGKGGKRMTPEDISRERQIAASLMQTDYSPIQSPWQGLARVAGNVTGALRERRADKAQEANAEASRRITEALMGGGDPSSTIGSPVDTTATVGPWTVPVDGSPMPVTGAEPPLGAQSPAPGGGSSAAIIAALSDPYLDAGTKSMAMAQYQRMQPVRQKIGNDFVEFNPMTGQSKVLYQGVSDRAPHYWETNDGSLGVVGPDGKPTILYQDPAAKMNFIPDGLGGGQWVAVPRAAPNMPAAATPEFAGWADDKGGPASKAPGGF